MENNKKRIDFELQEDASIIDVIYGILENNGLGPAQDLRQWPKKGEEPQAVIIRDAAVTIFKKAISEEKLTELLQKHLKVSVEVAKKIILEVKQKLVPYAKEVSAVTDETNLSTREILIRKIKSNVPVKKSFALPVEKVKDIEIKNVEKNAQKIKQERKPIISQNIEKSIEEKPGTQESKPDTYREPIE